MRKILLFFLTFFISIFIFSETFIQKDPQIEKMVKEISPDSLRSYVTKLVDFGTRNTLNTQTDPSR